MSNSYKIDLGISLNQDDLGKIKTQLNNFQNQHKIELEINRKKIDSQLNSIRKQIQNLSNIKIDLGRNGSNSLSLNTEGLNESLQTIATSINAIKHSLGTLDDGGEMKSLLSSINQIATALGKVENESETLVKSLNALSKKDFSLNIDVKLGGSNSVNNNALYGDFVKNDVLPTLKKQEQALTQYLAKYFNTNEFSAVDKLLSKSGNGLGGIGGIIALMDKLESPLKKGESLKDKMREYQNFINSIISSANMQGIDLSPILSQFEKLPNELIESADNIRNGTQEIDNSIEKLKNIFGSGIDGEKLSAQLDSIVEDLKGIKDAIQGLSQNNAIDGITQSFKEMSVVLKDITDNLTIFKNAFGSVGSGLGTSINNATQGLNNNINVLDSFKRSLQNIGMGADEIDNVANRIENLGVQIETLNQSKSINGDKGILTVDISGIDKMGNAIKLTEQYDIATGKLIKSIDKVSTVQQTAGTSTDTFVQKQKNAVSDLTNTINKLHRASIDQNAPRSITDSTHLDALENKYNDIVSAIQRMENASSDTFVDERNNVKKLISEYQVLVREIRNAENVATSLRSKDISTVKDTYSSKLDVLISKMKSSGVYTAGFESGAENLRSILANATDAGGLVKFLNGLDKLEAGYRRAAAAVTEFNRSQKVGINVSGLESKIADIQRISPEIDQFETEINGAKVSVKSLLSDLSKVRTQADFSVVNARFKAFVEAAKAAGIAVTEVATQVSSVNKIKLKLDDTGFNGFEQEVQRVHAAAEELKETYPELEAALKRLDIAMANVYSADQDNDVQRLVAANEEYEIALKAVYSQLKLNQQAEKKAYEAEILKGKKASLSSEMEIWLKENSRAAKQFCEDIRRLQASLDGLDANGVKLVAQQFKNITKQAQVMGKTGLTTFDKLKSKVKEYAAYLSAAEIFMYAQQALRGMFEQVKLIDSAMTELKKVTDESAAAYEKFLTNAADRAREIGTTIDGLVSSTADFARLGYGFEDAQGLAEVANIYAVVGDEIEGVEGATESLISTMAAFKNEMNGMSDTEFAMSIIDKFNEIGNNFAISSGGIGEALERSASSLMAANNTIDESIALITAANTVVQDPEAVGKWLADIKSGYIG